MKKFYLFIFAVCSLVINCCGQKNDSAKQTPGNSKSNNTESKTLTNTPKAILCGLTAKDLKVKKLSFNKLYKDSTNIYVEYFQISAPKTCSDVDSFNANLKHYPKVIFEDSKSEFESNIEEEAGVPAIEQGFEKVLADHYLNDSILSINYKGKGDINCCPSRTYGWALGQNFNLRNGKQFEFNQIFKPTFNKLILEKALILIEKPYSKAGLFFNKYEIENEVKEALDQGNFYFDRAGVNFIIKTKHAESLNESLNNYFLIEFTNEEVKPHLL